MENFLVPDPDPKLQADRQEIARASRHEPSESVSSPDALDDLDDLDDGLSLEELSQVYARMMGAEVTNSAESAAKVSESDMGQIGPSPAESCPARLDSSEQSLDGHLGGGPAAEETGEPGQAQSEDDSWPVTPTAIVEAVLMVGRPDGAAITATEIAGLMRGVSEAEVDQIVEELNADYRANDRALRIASIGGGYRLQLADDLAPIAEAFLGPARPVRLNQASIDCLALISYQPGITREQLNDQLGKSCGPILNQLVRRELLEMRRQKIEGKATVRYYPTDRLLNLVGLDSFDDLPTAEEWIDRQ